MKNYKKIKFEVSSRTVNLLGKENALDSRSALIELVKNSYDADATFAYINLQNNCIEIIDNGVGMSLNTIENAYFNIGTSNKKIKVKSEKKRVLNGSMGIGRLSLGCLGQVSKIYTGNKEGYYCFEIDWNLFENNDLLSDIEFNIYNISEEEFTEQFQKRKLLEYTGKKEFNHGTIIVTSFLNEQWDTKYFEKLEKNLKQINNLQKNNLDSEFKIIFNFFDSIKIIENSIEDFMSDANINIFYKNKILYLEGLFNEIDISVFSKEFIDKYILKNEKLFIQNGKIHF